MVEPRWGFRHVLGVLVVRIMAYLGAFGAFLLLETPMQAQLYELQSRLRIIRRIRQGFQTGSGEKGLVEKADSSLDSNVPIAQVRPFRPRQSQ